MRVFKKRPDSQNWTIELRDHRRICRRFAGLADRRQSEQVGRWIEHLCGLRASGLGPDKSAAEWLEKAPDGLKKRLAVVGLIDGARVSAAKPLSELVDDYAEHLRAKEDTADHVQRTAGRLRRIFEGCRFAVFSDITAARVERFLKGLRDGGLSAATSNHYLTALKVFCGWMVNSGQATENPIRSVRAVNAKVDVRRQRRAATADELRKLIATTTNGPERFGMTGAERSLLYRFCAETGLRANECRTLTAGSFDLDGLTVTVRAAYSKHRERDTVPLRPELAEALREHLGGKLPASKVFGGSYVRLTDRTADMLKADLADAGLPYEDDRGALDFHGLRHTFITGLSHAPSRVAQKLARHKSSDMTDRYTHVRLNDERAALGLLPDLTLPAESEAGKKTGTTDGPVDAIGAMQNKGSDIRNSGARHGALLHTNTRNGPEAGAKQNRTGDSANAVSDWARLDSNQRPEDYESPALPLSYGPGEAGGGLPRGGSVSGGVADCKGFRRPQRG